jgi:hypothetical protein
MQQPLLEPSVPSTPRKDVLLLPEILILVLTNLASLVIGPSAIYVGLTFRRDTEHCSTTVYCIWLVVHGIFLLFRFSSYLVYLKWEKYSNYALWSTIACKVINFILFLMGTILFWTAINTDGCPHDPLWQLAQLDSVLYLVYYIFLFLRILSYMCNYCFGPPNTSSNPGNTNTTSVPTTNDTLAFEQCVKNFV